MVESRAISLVDRRAVFGAVSLWLTGAWLTVAAILFADAFGAGQNLIKSRLFWELALSIQIVSLALMWEAHIERFEDVSPEWPRSAVMERIIGGLLLASAPLWGTLLALQVNVFGDGTEIVDVHRGMMIIGLILLAFYVVLPTVRRLWPQAGGPAAAHLKPFSLRGFIADHVVVLCLVAVNLATVWGIYKPAVLITPLLLYAQFSLPYLKTAFGIERRL